MKKILFLITKAEFGGAQKAVFDLATALKNQYEITVACGKEGQGENDLISKLKQQNINGIYLNNLKRNISPISDLLAIKEIKTLIKNLKPDIIHLNSSKAGVLGSYAAHKIPRSQRPKVIYCIGGWSFKEKTSWSNHLIYFKAEKWSAKFKDRIITVCESDRQLAIKLKVAPMDKVTTIHNGINFDTLKFLEKNEALKSLGLQNMNHKIIGTIANFYKNKGLNYLIEAAKNIKDATFVIIGEGAERKNLESLILKNNLRDRFLLLGAKDNASQYLTAFDVFVLPSLKEGMPWVILEAMTAGLPIIATNVGGIPEIVENEKSGILIEPANSKILEEKINYLLQNPDVAKKLGEVAKEKVKEFSLEKMVTETQKLLF